MFSEILDQILIGHECKRIYRDNTTMVYIVEDMKITLHYDQNTNKLQSATIRPRRGKGEQNAENQFDRK